MAIEAMKRALRLTTQGRLQDAVRTIQDGLLGEAPSTRPAGTPELRPAAPPPSTKPRGKMVERRHDGAAGSLEYCLYIPKDRPGEPVSPMPLLVMLHGCTQSPQDFARGTDMNRHAEAAGVIVAWPLQTSAANGQKCWNWFRAADQQRGQGEAALIAGMVRDITRECRVDSSRVYIAGLSAGGAAAANLAAAYPDVFAGVAIHSGLVQGAARNLPNALSAMRQGSSNPPDAAQQFVPTITFHGTRDTTVSPINAQQIVAAAHAAYPGPLSDAVETGGQPGGHSYTRTISRDPAGKPMIEQWTIAGAGHAWSGGSQKGSYTDPAGPDASEAMLQFLLQHSLQHEPQ